MAAGGGFGLGPGCHVTVPAQKYNPMGPLNVDTSVLDGQAVLHLRGEIDYGSVDRLDEALESVQAQKVSMIILDLAGLTFIDTSGLNRLVVALKHQRQTGGEIVLRSPSPQTRRVLEIVGLNQVFTIA